MSLALRCCSCQGLPVQSYSSATDLKASACIPQLLSHHRQACQWAIHLRQPAGPWAAAAAAAALQPGAAAARWPARARGRPGAYTKHDRET